MTAASDRAMAKAMKRYDRWLEDEVSQIDQHIAWRKKKGRNTATYEARAKELRRCRGRLQDIAREELTR